jgi:hypothetical protein
LRERFLRHQESNVVVASRHWRTKHAFWLRFDRAQLSSRLGNRQSPATPVQV